MPVFRIDVEKLMTPWLQTGIVDELEVAVWWAYEKVGFFIPFFAVRNFTGSSSKKKAIKKTAKE
ncbi:hypothetical protein [Desulfopila inferna]|uniref:hypothetical protein n=1 Tax=Desulfopila inferna TaxID=468528 RepID=UPI0019644499|nr:hypothetical protein [Desulfopila inferna]MBM9603165.1 hypothetical protein [Desulfopila inferna]